jgi:phenylalanyl-tRNA synthetase beta chain
MVGLGFTEIISYSFISPDSIDLLGAGMGSHLRSFVKILNPLTVDQSVMRTSLIPGLLAAVKTNISHGEEDLKLFEWGKIFIHNEKDELPHEKPLLAGIMTGFINQKEWYREEKIIDFYDIKGAVESLLKTLGVNGAVFQKSETHPGYHHELSSAIYFSDRIIGNIGQISREVLERYDVKTENAYLFELDMGTLMEQLPATKNFEPVTKFPAVYRDISLMIKREVKSEKILEIIQIEGGKLVEFVKLFDLYEGGKIDPSEKALSFRICYRAKDRTLEGREINQLHETIIDRIMQKTGGRLREG